MTPAQFDIKDIKNEGDLPTVTPNESFDDILKVSNDAIISQPQQVVKGDSKNSSEEMKQSAVMRTILQPMRAETRRRRIGIKSEEARQNEAGF